MVMETSERVEMMILQNLIYNEDYCRKSLPFIRNDYFDDFNEKIVFETIAEFIVQYDTLPTKEILSIEVEKRRDVTEDQFRELAQKISDLTEKNVDYQWLINTTEKWCKDRAIYLALMESIQIADGSDSKKLPDSIPSILSDALSVSFDNNIGHDYLQDYEARYETYHRKEDKIEFDLDYFNKITKGGLPNKTLNIALAGTGVGKSLFMCHLVAPSCSKDGTFCTLQWKWQKRKLLNELTQTY